jgi:hypothetical protein
MSIKLRHVFSGDDPFFWLTIGILLSFALFLLGCSSERKPHPHYARVYLNAEGNQLWARTYNYDYGQFEWWWTVGNEQWEPSAARPPIGITPTGQSVFTGVRGVPSPVLKPETKETEKDEVEEDSTEESLEVGEQNAPAAETPTDSSPGAPSDSGGGSPGGSSAASSDAGGGGDGGGGGD